MIFCPVDNSYKGIYKDIYKGIYKHAHTRTRKRAGAGRRPGKIVI